MPELAWLEIDPGNELGGEDVRVLGVGAGVERNLHASRRLPVFVTFCVSPLEAWRVCSVMRWKS